MKNDIVFKRYKECKSERQKYLKAWIDVNKYVNVLNDVTSNFEDGRTISNHNKDVYINDPTAQIAVQNSADYIMGIIWGSGEGVFDIVPSEEVLQLVGSANAVKPYYDYITKTTSKQMNHSEAGLLPALISFLQDQVSFGTSGVGCFPNSDFTVGKAENAFIFQRYSVNNCCIDEGKNGRINVIFSIHHWRTSRIVQEFAMIDEVIDDKLFAKLPKEVREAWEKQDFGKVFKLVNCIMPNSDYLTGKAGVKGTKYKGVWWLEAEEKIFFDEFYKELPIAFARLMKASDQVYGLSPALLCLSSIRLLNFAMGQAAESVEKLNRPARGVFSGALPNGSEIDDSAGGITVFNGKASGKELPIFNISNVGDISALVQLLIPKLEQDITNVFKIDKLLDFNNLTQMTATESLHRFGIRIKSIASMIMQLVNEGIKPLVVRAISVLDHLDLLGYQPQSKEGQRLVELGITNMIIPDAVTAVKNSGRAWYEIKFRNEIEKFNNADMYENLGKFLNIYGAMLQFKPELVEVIKPYQLIELLQQVTGLENDNITVSEIEFKKILEAKAQQQNELMQMQAEQMNSQTTKNFAEADKKMREE